MHKSVTQQNHFYLRAQVFHQAHSIQTHTTSAKDQDSCIFWKCAVLVSTKHPLHCSVSCNTRTTHYACKFRGHVSIVHEIFCIQCNNGRKSARVGTDAKSLVRARGFHI